MPSSQRIEAAAEEYPYPDRYHVWPGPNSNTFTAFILRRVPELRVDLPPTAIGKDYLGWKSVGKTPSGTGGQASLFGVVGVAAGLEEGLEVNLLGLNFGVDPKSLSIEAAHRRTAGSGARQHSDPDRRARDRRARQLNAEKIRGAPLARRAPVLLIRRAAPPPQAIA